MTRKTRKALFRLFYLLYSLGALWGGAWLMHATEVGDWWMLPTLITIFFVWMVTTCFISDEL